MQIGGWHVYSFIVDQRFSALTRWTWLCFVAGRGPLECQALSSIAGFRPRNARSSISGPVATTRSVFRCFQVSPTCGSSLTWGALLETKGKWKRLCSREVLLRGRSGATGEAPKGRQVNQEQAWEEDRPRGEHSYRLRKWIVSGFTSRNVY